MDSADIAIIGGGISGTSLAYHLARRGAGRVVLLERGLLGSGSTGAAAGGVRAQFTTAINVRLSLLAQQLWRRFPEEIGAPHQIVPTGYLFLAQTAAELAALERAVALQQSLGVPSRLVSPAEMAELVPALRVDDLVGGSYCPTDGVGTPNDAVQGYAQAVRRLGVTIQEQTELAAVEIDRGRIQALRLANGDRLAVGQVVNCAGPWSGEVGRLAGVDVPVRPFRREIFVSEPFPELPPGPLTIDLRRGWYFRKEGERVVMSGGLDTESSWNIYVDWAGLPRIARTATHRVPVLARASFSGGWAGLYDLSPDNHALLGPVPELPNFWLACGFSGHGYMHAPATGLLLAEWLLDGEPHTLDVRALSIARIRQGKLMAEALTTHGEVLSGG